MNVAHDQAWLYRFSLSYFLGTTTVLASRLNAGLARLLQTTWPFSESMPHFCCCRSKPRKEWKAEKTANSGRFIWPIVFSSILCFDHLNHLLICWNEFCGVFGKSRLPDAEKSPKQNKIHISEEWLGDSKWAQKAMIREQGEEETITSFLIIYLGMTPIFTWHALLDCWICLNCSSVFQLTT